MSKIMKYPPPSEQSRGRLWTRVGKGRRKPVRMVETVETVEAVETVETADTVETVETVFLKHVPYIFLCLFLNLWSQQKKNLV